MIDANLFFFAPRMKVCQSDNDFRLLRGLNLRAWQVEHELRLVHPLGESYHDGDRLIPGYQINLVDQDNLPRRAGDKAILGRFERREIEGSKRTILTGYDPETREWFLELRTGLLVNNRSGKTEADLQDLIARGLQPRPHGSFSLDDGAVALGGLDESQIPEISADRVRWATARRGIRTTGCPQYRRDLWRIPVGAEVLTQDVDPSLPLVRVIGEENRLNVVDADGYESTFQALEDTRQETRRAERERRQNQTV